MSLHSDVEAWRRLLKAEEDKSLTSHVGLPGRWRSTLVAIKVVEHSPGISESMSLAEQKIEREALLATSLSHPNIIATFKICTMTAGAHSCFAIHPE